MKEENNSKTNSCNNPESYINRDISQLNQNDFQG